MMAARKSGEAIAGGRRASPTTAMPTKPHQSEMATEDTDANGKGKMATAANSSAANTSEVCRGFRATTAVCKTTMYRRSLRMRIRVSLRPDSEAPHHYRLQLSDR